MPSPMRLLRYLAAGYACIVSAGMFGFASYRLITDGGLGSHGQLMNVVKASLFLAWLACCAVTGWNGMTREAQSQTQNWNA